MGGTYTTVTASDGTGEFSAAGLNTTGTISGTFNYTGGAENSNSTDSVAFRMVYSDASGATNQVVGGSQSSPPSTSDMLFTEDSFSGRRQPGD